MLSGKVKKGGIVMQKTNKNGTLVSFRPTIKVVDCTMRDGGLVNNFAFSDSFVKALYQAI